MSEPINDGGPAFPVKYASDGMTLRDFFAAKAMQALITRGEFRVGMDEPSKQQQAATLAYSFASRMVSARELL